jgi:cytochrome c nitrite reductase small subunit
MLKKLYAWLLPPASWRFTAIVITGIMAGLFFFLVYVSDAASYLSDDPKACVNCHIMAPEYATWAHSSHREAAHCNDCHVPHDNFFNTYYFKAKDGLRHAYMFTLRLEPQTIFIKEDGKRVVQQNCHRCHDDLIRNERVMAFTDSFHGHSRERLCWDCHRETPHGRVQSLSSVPFARVPGPGSPVPSWLNRIMNNK